VFALFGNASGCYEHTGMQVFFGVINMQRHMAPKRMFPPLRTLRNYEVCLTIVPCNVSPVP